MAPTPPTTRRRSKRTLTIKSSAKSAASAAGSGGRGSARGSARPPIHPSTSKKNLSSTAVVASTSKRGPGRPKGTKSTSSATFKGFTEAQLVAIHQRLKAGNLSGLSGSLGRVDKSTIAHCSLPEDGEMYFDLPHHASLRHLNRPCLPTDKKDHDEWVKRYVYKILGSGACLDHCRSNATKAKELLGWVNKALATSYGKLEAFDFVAIIEEVQQAKAEEPDASYPTILFKKEDTTLNKILEQMSTAIAQNAATTGQLAAIASRHDEQLALHQQKHEQQENINEQVDQRVCILENYMTPRRAAILDQMWEQQLAVPTPAGGHGTPDMSLPYDGSGEGRTRLTPKTLKFEDDDDDDEEYDDDFDYESLTSTAGLKTTGLDTSSAARPKTSTAAGLKTTGLPEEYVAGLGSKESTAAGLKTTGLDTPAAAGRKTSTAGPKTTGLDPSSTSGSKQKQPPPASVSGTTNKTPGLKQPPPGSDKPKPPQSPWMAYAEKKAKEEKQNSAKKLAATKATMEKKKLKTKSKSGNARDVKAAGLPKDANEAYENDDYLSDDEEEGPDDGEETGQGTDPTGSTATAADDGEEKEESASSAQTPKKSRIMFMSFLGF